VLASSSTRPSIVGVTHGVVAAASDVGPGDAGAVVGTWAWNETLDTLECMFYSVSAQECLF
jgi:hypothetical protein